MGAFHYWLKENTGATPVADTIKQHWGVLQGIKSQEFKDDLIRLIKREQGEQGGHPFMRLSAAGLVPSVWSLYKGGHPPIEIVRVLKAIFDVLPEPLEMFGARVGDTISQCPRPYTWYDYQPPTMVYPNSIVTKLIQPGVAHKKGDLRELKAIISVKNS